MHGQVDVGQNYHKLLVNEMLMRWNNMTGILHSVGCIELLKNTKMGVKLIIFIAQLSALFEVFNLLGTKIQHMVKHDEAAIISAIYLLPVPWLQQATERNF